MSGVHDPVGGEDVFWDLFDVVPKFLRLNINGKSRAKNIFLYNSNGGCRINHLVLILAKVVPARPLLGAETLIRNTRHLWF